MYLKVNVNDIQKVKFTDFLKLSLNKMNKNKGLYTKLKIVRNNG
jgi:hypothetical protein